jgi:hypothetical protein
MADHPMTLLVAIFIFPAAFFFSMQLISMAMGRPSNDDLELLELEE